MRPERRAEPEIFDKREGLPIRRGTQSKGVLRLHFVPLWTFDFEFSLGFAQASAQDLRLRLLRLDDI